MHHSSDVGSTGFGTYLMMLTVLLYGVSQITVSGIAGVCTIVAALSTIAVNIKRYNNKK